MAEAFEEGVNGIADCGISFLADFWQEKYF